MNVPQPRLFTATLAVFLLSSFFLFQIIDKTYASDVKSIKANPNYMVVLVHGKNSSHKIFTGEQDANAFGVDIIGNEAFGNLKKYLEEELGLKGYVFDYDFSNSELGLEQRGWELGDRKYLNPKYQMCWLEKAKKDFRSIHPNNIPVPNKFILVGHSMGGLSIMHYLSGSDEKGLNYYKNDIEKVVTIATPHLGTDASDVLALNVNHWSALETLFSAELAWAYIFNRLFQSNYSLINTGGGMLSINNPLDLFDPVSNYLDGAALHAGVITPSSILTVRKAFGDPESLSNRDLRTNSPIIKKLK
jgi:triacylglycerol esterase/lipase EstA (alpha/beta hydrolase family)